MTYAQAKGSTDDSPRSTIHGQPRVRRIVGAAQYPTQTFFRKRVPRLAAPQPEKRLGYPFTFQ